jgi:hypothetical protein
MTVWCYADPQKSWSRPFMEWFARGVRACGGKAQMVTDMIYREGPAAFYGVNERTYQVFDTARRSQHPWYYVDNGYFLSKWHGGMYHRITRNGFQHDGAGASAGERFARLGVKLAPWRNFHRPTARVTIAVQTEWWYRFMGTSQQAWLLKTKAELKRAGVVDPVVRMKPTDKKDIAIDWDAVQCVVAHSSNTAIDGLVHGVPCAVTHACGAQRMSAPDLSGAVHPVYPEREEWAAVLADNQWLPEEIEAGVAWKTLNR